MAAAQPAYSDYVPIPCPKPKPRLRLVVSNPGKEARRNKKTSSYGERCIVISRARYYDPKVGRFVTKDPIGFAGGVNLYSYVFNSPVNATEPYGLMSLPSVWKDYEKKAELQKRLDELNKMYEDAVLKCSNGILNECQCNWLYKYLSEEIEKIERQKLSTYDD